LEWPYKLVTGKQHYSTWTGPVYPNCSTIESYQERQGPLAPDVLVFGERVRITNTPEEFDHGTWTRDCGPGCLFNVKDDPTEHLDLAQDASYATVLARLQNSLQTLNKDVFKPNRGTARVEACKVAIEYGRVFGPFVDLDGFYSPAPERSLTQKIDDAALMGALSFVNNDKVKPVIVEAVNAVGPWAMGLLVSDKCISGKQSLAKKERLSDQLESPESSGFQV
jgi:hypothetical protein